MKKMLFVLNPCAGTRKANRYLAEIIGIFNRADYAVEVFVTDARDAARKIACQKAGTVDLIVCCGGDGTFHETVSGIMQSGAQCPIGYIPAGSTNDLAASLGLPGNILKAAQEVADGVPTPIDLGRFGEQYFAYIASFGAFTKASYATPQNVKNALGHTAYILSGIQELSQIRKKHVRFVIDDELVEDDFLFGAVCNSTSVAGILTLDPKQVDMQDGKFEVMLVRAPHDLAEVSECIHAVQNKVYNCRMITFRAARKIEVFADAQMNWSLDGECAQGQAHFVIENMQHAFRLVKGG